MSPSGCTTMSLGPLRSLLLDLSAIKPPTPAAKNERRGRKRESSFMSVPLFVCEPTVYSGGIWDLVALLGEFRVQNGSAHLRHDCGNLDRLARIFCDPESYLFRA